jgi:hypothetical protein
MENRRYLNFETLFRSLKEALAVFLKENGIYYECSGIGAFCGWHFEVLCNETEEMLINTWLDSQTIQEEKQNE